jgi:uncharacterized membrane protein
MVMGAFTGACLAAGGGQAFVVGGLIGIVGALAGTFAGYHARARRDKALGTPDYVVAAIEDLCAIGGSLWLVSRF